MEKKNSKQKHRISNKIWILEEKNEKKYCCKCLSLQGRATDRFVRKKKKKPLLDNSVIEGQTKSEIDGKRRDQRVTVWA